MGEYRLLIGVITFIGVFGLIIGSAPIGYLVPYSGSGAVTPPALFETPANWNYTAYHSFTIDNQTLGYNSLTSRNWRYFYPINSTLFVIVLEENQDGDWLGIQIGVVTFYLFDYAFYQVMSWYGPEGAALGTYLTREQMNYDFSTFTTPYPVTYNISLDITLENQSVILAWDNATYTDPWDAFDSQALHLLHGIRWVSPSATGAPVLTPLEQYAANLAAVLAFAVDPRVPFLIRMIIMTPISAAIGFLLFWIGKTILHG